VVLIPEMNLQSLIERASYKTIIKFYFCITYYTTLLQRIICCTNTSNETKYVMLQINNYVVSSDEGNWIKGGAHYASMVILGFANMA